MQHKLINPFPVLDLKCLGVGVSISVGTEPGHWFLDIEINYVWGKSSLNLEW